MGGSSLPPSHPTHCPREREREREMSGSGVLTSLILLVVFLLTVIHGEDGEDFFKRCPPSNCSRDGPEVRFPLRIQSSPTSCGIRGLDLSCSGNGSNQTIVILPFLGPYTVLAINYSLSRITIKPLDSQNPCPLRNLSSINPASASLGGSYFSDSVSLVSCSKRFTPSDEDDEVAGPISCLGGADRFIYVASTFLYMDRLPVDCKVFSTGGKIPDVYGPTNSFKDEVLGFAQGRELNIRWQWYTSDSRFSEDQLQCEACEAAGNRCGLRQEGNQPFCISSGHHGLNIMLIVGTSIGGFIILLFVALILLYISRKSDKEKQTRLKVEKFLEMYKATNPTRYTYASIKRITKRFKHKLGHGGFGSVYKGELENGIPVAVKMLEKSKGDGEEFTNEVATIGRIHHANIVRLLGFCSEGSSHALVYEFLPNESLEKFIFSIEAETTCRPLGLEKLQEITLGVAQGIEYLHQGCNERILHFDIKPHNILLDHDFNPKISDFGLAKLCSRDDSIVTMTAARGTMGYIAPEIYSRNFGTVSYKSDVYSFGMLVLEMVSGRKNIEPTIENQDEVYFPEWVYDRLVDGQDLGLITNEKGRDEEIAKKLVVVALWCIQWNPTERPSMTKVIQMLMGNLESLQMPPKPFVSSSN